jgi:serine/threonine-protein kinase ULK/ATG1
MHRDLKPENLLLHNGALKLADFGFCKPLESEDEISRTMLGSPIYMAPELLKGEPYTIKADIWSLGVVLFRMLFGYCPFESSSIAKLILVVEQEELVFPGKPVVAPEVQALLRRMLTKNAKNRADWSEIFSYELANGQLVQRKADVNEPLKESLATTNTDADSLKTAKVRSPIKMKQLVSPGKKEEKRP